MKTTSWLLTGVALAASTLALLLAAPSLAKSPAEANTAKPIAMSALHWPRGHSERPKRSEWKTATTISLTRNTDRACSAKRIREWVEIRCSGWNHGGDSPMIAGTKANVDMWIANRDHWPTEPATVIVMPVRVGDRRVFQLNLQHRWGTSPESMVSELWLDEASEPVIVITDI